MACGGWLGEAKVSCSFCHLGAQLILAYSWVRPAVFAEGKSREEMLLFLLFLLFISFTPLPYLSLSSPKLIILWESMQNNRQELTWR